VSERPITRAEVILTANVVGGIPMLDKGEADDKIIGVLVNDPIWGHVEDATQLPAALVERLRHYFLTYKVTPGREAEVSIGPTYGRAHAEAVITAAKEDYDAEFGTT
jgi:inorganic pyrophosphatase